MRRLNEPQVVKIFKTTKVNGQFFATVGNVQGTDNEVETLENNVELWFPAGFVSIPPDVQEDQACAEAILDTSRDQSKVSVYRDFRAQDIVGDLKPGECCVYNLGEDCQDQSRIFLKRGGVISSYTTVGNTSDGESMSMTLDPENGASIMVDKSHISIGTDNVISVGNGNGGFQIDADGNLTFNVKAVQFNCESMLLGSDASDTSSAAVAELVDLLFNALANATPVAQDGGAAIQSALKAVLQSVASGSVKVGS